MVRIYVGLLPSRPISGLNQHSPQHVSRLAEESIRLEATSDRMRQRTDNPEASGEEIRRIFTHKDRAFATVHTSPKWSRRTLRGCSQAKDSLDASKLETSYGTLKEISKPAIYLHNRTPKYQYHW